MIPFQITFLDFPESDAVWVAIQSRVEKLEHFYDRIVRCEVTVACPHRHRKMNRLYHVQIHLSIPGEDVYVNRNPSKNEAHRDIYVAIRDTFNAAERILQDKVRIVRHKVKFHEPTSTEGKIPTSAATSSLENFATIVCITGLFRLLSRYSFTISTKLASGQPMIGGMPWDRPLS